VTFLHSDLIKQFSLYRLLTINVLKTCRIIFIDFLNLICIENESYQRFECVYLGKTETKSAYGIETITDSLTKLTADSEQYRWIEVFMDIASSHIKILDRRVIFHAYM